MLDNTKWATKSLGQPTLKLYEAMKNGLSMLDCFVVCVCKAEMQTKCLDSTKM